MAESCRAGVESLHVSPETFPHDQFLTDIAGHLVCSADDGRLLEDGGRLGGSAGGCGPGGGGEAEHGAGVGGDWAETPATELEPGEGGEAEGGAEGAEPAHVTVIGAVPGQLYSPGRPQSLCLDKVSLEKVHNT